MSEDMSDLPEPSGSPELLVAEPLVRTEIKIGYARVSTGGQMLEWQIDALTDAGCRKIFADKKSGKTDLRPELKARHAFLDAGDTLVVPSLDRYGRSLQDLINMVAELRTREIGFTSLHETSTPPPPAADSSSTSSPHSPSSSANSSSRAPARAWPPPAPAAGSADAPPSPRRKSSRPPATSCPTPDAPSPRSPGS